MIIHRTKFASILSKDAEGGFERGHIPVLIPFGFLTRQEGLLPSNLTGVECAIRHVERLRPCDRMETKADKMRNWLSFYV